MSAFRALAVLIGVGLIAGLVADRSPVRSAISTGHYQEFGDSGGFLNILPPGQDGVLNGAEAIAARAGTYPAHVRDQLGMYGDLVYNTPGLSESALTQYYKDASFGVPESDIDRVYSPVFGVTVVRDKSFGVPHIFGETRYATMFAQGYTGAEDRLFLMDALRHVGRARLSEFLGASPSNEELDREQLAIAPYTEADLTAQAQAIRDSGPEGQAIGADATAYVDGVNAYIRRISRASASTAALEGRGHHRHGDARRRRLRQGRRRRADQLLRHQAHGNRAGQRSGRARGLRRPQVRERRRSADDVTHRDAVHDEPRPGRPCVAPRHRL